MPAPYSDKATKPLACRIPGPGRKNTHQKIAPVENPPRKTAQNFRAPGRGISGSTRPPRRRPPPRPAAAAKRIADFWHHAPSSDLNAVFGVGASPVSIVPPNPAPAAAAARPATCDPTCDTAGLAGVGGGGGGGGADGALPNINHPFIGLVSHSRHVQAHAGATILRTCAVE